MPFLHLSTNNYESDESLIIHMCLLPVISFPSFYPSSAPSNLASLHASQGLVELLNSHRDMWSTMKEESSTLWQQKSKVRRDEALAALAAAKEKEAKGMCVCYPAGFEAF